MARRIVGAIVLVLALAGCGGDPKADPSPAPSPSTSPASTTPSAPAMPDAAKANTKAGAIAFVRHYIDGFNAAQANGDTRDLEALSSTKCGECSRVIAALHDIYRSGGHIEGGALHAGAATAQENGAEHFWLILMRVESGPQVVVKSGGATPQTLAGGERAMQFSVTRAGDSWMVASWTRK